jgi:hypothetical protein
MVANVEVQETKGTRRNINTFLELTLELRVTDHGLSPLCTTEAISATTRQPLSSEQGRPRG